MAYIRARGIVKDRKEAVERIGDTATTRYYLYIRFTNPETNDTGTERFSCKSEHQYRQYYVNDSVGVRRDTDKFLWVFDYGWEIDD